jgi:hypothetical protein
MYRSDSRRPQAISISQRIRGMNRILFDKCVVQLPDSLIRPLVAVTFARGKNTDWQDLTDRLKLPLDHSPARNTRIVVRSKHSNVLMQLSR